MELKHRQILSAQVDLSKFNKANFEKATDEEKKQQDVMGESTTFFKDGMRRLRKNPLAMGSIIVLVLILLTIIIAPHVCPYKYSEIISVNGVRDKSAANLGPFEYSKLETKYMNETGEKLFPPRFKGFGHIRRGFNDTGLSIALDAGVFHAISSSLLSTIHRPGIVERCGCLRNSLVNHPKQKFHVICRLIGQLVQRVRHRRSIVR